MTSRSGSNLAKSTTIEDEANSKSKSGKNDDDGWHKQFELVLEMLARNGSQCHTPLLRSPRVSHGASWSRRVCGSRTPSASEQGVIAWVGQQRRLAREGGLAPEQLELLELVDPTFRSALEAASGDEEEEEREEHSDELEDDSDYNEDEDHDEDEDNVELDDDEDEDDEDEDIGQLHDAIAGTVPLLGAA
jgi:hypothetical protein